jgi:hypothetical protein
MRGMSRALTPAWLAIAVFASFAVGFVLVPTNGQGHDPVPPASAQPVSRDGGAATTSDVVALGPAKALPRLAVPRRTVVRSRPRRRAARVVVKATPPPASSVAPATTTPTVQNSTPVVTPTQTVTPPPTPTRTPAPRPSKPAPQRSPSPSPQPAPASTTFDSTG